jgi:hypothetical protein
LDANLCLLGSVAEPHHVDAAPDPASAPGRQNDVAPVPAKKNLILHNELQVLYLVKNSKKCSF